MEKSEIQRILSAQICILRRSTEEEQKELFSEKIGLGGSYYTFGLASGQRFVGYVPEEEQTYTFRPIKTLIPDLLEIRWEKKKDVADLGYITTCQFKKGSLAEKSFCEEVLSPKTVSAPFLTKLAFQHYSYHPMLEKAFWLQKLNQQHKETQKALLKIQEEKNALMIPEQKNLIQQKLKERRQNG